MPERMPHIIRPDIAPVVHIQFNKTARARALRDAKRPHVEPDHQTGYLEKKFVKDIADDLFDGDLEAYLGSELVLQYGSRDDSVSQRVQETEFQDGRRGLTTIVSREEYEWLTANVDDYWEGKAPSDIGVLLGRYYRLALLTDYLLSSRGFTDYAHPALNDRVELGGEIIDMSAPAIPVTSKSEEAREDAIIMNHDRARLRVAGGFALAALQDEREEVLVDYLRFSIEDRVSYAMNGLRFAKRARCGLPDDLARELGHWEGVCLPLSPDQVADRNLWKPDPRVKLLTGE